MGKRVERSLILKHGILAVVRIVLLAARAMLAWRTTLVASGM